jgi:polyphosphate glucokinase
MSSDKRQLASARILAIDIGGSHIKAVVLSGDGRLLTEPVRADTPVGAVPRKFVRAILALVEPFAGYECVSVGFPGYIRAGKVFSAPNLDNDAWKGFDLVSKLEKRLSKPVRLANDADVQGLAAIRGKGLEFVCTLGTGLGTAWFQDGKLLPHMELAHMRIGSKRDFDKYLGNAARRKIGDKKWNQRVEKTISTFFEVFNYDVIYLGGGNSAKIGFKLPRNAKLIPNDDGLVGGAFLWRQDA